LAVEFLLLIFVLVGGVLAFRRRGAVARRARRFLLAGLVAGLTGCVGALSWLGAETSGRSNPFHEVNPYLWTALFGVGLLLMLVGAVGGVVAPRNADAGAGADVVDDVVDEGERREGPPEGD
jgi:hypothetical protein